MDQIIGPNRCGSCGGEYGEHAKLCPKQKASPVRENAKLVFENAERWLLRPPSAPGGSLLWARYPTSEGPVEIWLPPNTTVAEMTELVIPHFMKVLKLHLEWNESVQNFKEKTTPQLTPEDLVALYSEL